LRLESTSFEAVNVDDAGFVYADGMELCKTSSVIETFCVWFAAYAVFDIQYPKRWKNTLLFIQNLLGIQLKKMPTVVLELIGRINNSKS